MPRPGACRHQGQGSAFPRQDAARVCAAGQRHPGLSQGGGPAAHRGLIARGRNLPRRSWRYGVSDRDDFRQAAAKVLDRDEVEGVLSASFYAGPPLPRAAARPNLEEKPTHYKVICISMYTDDLKRLDQMVDTLKSRGLTKANRSALIRYALGEVDLERVPKGL